MTEYAMGISAVEHAQQEQPITNAQESTNNELTIIDVLPTEILVDIARLAPTAARACSVMYAAYQEAYKREIAQWAEFRARMSNSTLDLLRARWALLWACDKCAKDSYQAPVECFAYAYRLSLTIPVSELRASVARPLDPRIKYRASRTRIAIADWFGADVYMDALVSFDVLADFLVRMYEVPSTSLNDSIMWTAESVNGFYSGNGSIYANHLLSLVANDGSHDLVYYPFRQTADEVTTSFTVRLNCTQDLLEYVGNNCFSETYADGDRSVPLAGSVTANEHPGSADRVVYTSAHELPDLAAVLDAVEVTLDAADVGTERRTHLVTGSTVIVAQPRAG